MIAKLIGEKSAGMMKLIFEEGQRYCYECGLEFVPADNQNPERENLNEIRVRCPNPEHNRGAWATIQEEE